MTELSVDEQTDPRPVVVPGDDSYVVSGWRCRACGYPLAVAGPWCPRCRGDLVPESFGPLGTAWASTVVRVAVQDRQPPWGLVYVDFDNGPRILGHLEPPGTVVAVGSRVRLIGRSDLGDPLFAMEVSE